jgi:hypothetical protein
MSMLKNAKLTRVLNAGAGTASATPEKATTILDMQGFDSVMFVALLGDVVDTAVVTLKVAAGNTNDTNTLALLTGSATFTADATSADNKAVVLDVVHPNQRYLEAQLTHATANAPHHGILAIQYNAKDKPVTQSASIAASALLDNPALA